MHITSINEGTFVAYVTYRALKQVQFTTIKLELYSIQSILFDYGITIKLKDFPILEKVLTGIKKNHKPSPNTKLEITPCVLKRILAQLPQPGHYNAQIYRTAFSIAVFGMLRCGEFANDTQSKSIKTLQLHHIQITKTNDTHETLRLFIPVSKTDLFRQGVHIYLPCLCEFQSPCPVHECKKLLQLQKNLKLTMDPTSPLFLLADNSILQRKHVISLLNKLNYQFETDKQKLTGHSFRRGGATALAKNGTPDWIIQMLGRWKSQSYKRYIGCQPAQICEYIKHMIT